MTNIHRVFATFDDHSKQRLTDLIASLFDAQQEEWENLRTAYSALKNVQTRTLHCGTVEVVAQWNPLRLTNVQAKVDRDSIRQRECFLCEEHRPSQQRSIEYRSAYSILCNPSPIFHHHCTVVTHAHTPQEFLPYFSLLLTLSKDTDNSYTVLYNGPTCGASAPDHFHFQLIPWRSLPVETDCVDPHRRHVLHYQPHLLLATLKEYCRAVLILESDDENELTHCLEELITHWKRLKGLSTEPLFNVLCSYQQELWRIIVFPRTKHRPEAFYHPEPQRVLISPGAIDMGGVIITPRERDFISLTEDGIRAIYSEVSEPEEFVHTLVAQVYT